MTNQDQVYLESMSAWDWEAHGTPVKMINSTVKALCNAVLELQNKLPKPKHYCVIHRLDSGDWCLVGIQDQSLTRFTGIGSEERAKKVAKFLNGE